MLDKELIQRKIKLIQEDLKRLETFTSLTLEQVSTNPIQLAAFERYMERIIMRAIDINQHIILELGDGSEEVRGYFDTFKVIAKFGIYGEEFALKIAPSAGLRNRLVRDYNNTDPKLIYASLNNAIRDYKEYCRLVVKFID